jgi:hypothetical protein
MAKRKPADKVGIIVRMPEALRRQLAEAAKRNGRSLNAEIGRRLAQSFLWHDIETIVQSTASALQRAGIKPPTTKEDKS